MQKAEVFISYSHRDKAWVERLITHLKVLGDPSILKIWVDQSISLGAEWQVEIRNAMAKARIAVLMVSADFLGSDFIRQEEIPQLMKRRRVEGLHVLPVILRDCAWEAVPWLAPLQVWPRDGRPLAARRGNGIDTELAALAREILGILRAERKGTESPTVSLSGTHGM